MGIIDTIKNIGRNISAIGKSQMQSKEEEYSPERAQALKIAKGMQSRRQEYYASKRALVRDVEAERKAQKTFEREQFLKTPAQKRVSGVYGLMQKPGFTRKGQRYSVAGLRYSATKSRGVSVKSPGRPRLSYKLRTDPLTGRLVRMPATQLYKRQRLAKRLASASFQRRQMEKARFYQQRGIPPQQAAQIEMIKRQQMMERMEQQPQQIQQPVPQRVVYRQQPAQQFAQYPITPSFPMERQTTTVSPNFFTGGTQLRPKEKWLQ